MQNVMMPLAAEVSSPIAMPIGRETMEVPLFTGDKHVRISVYKDDFLKQIQIERGLLSNHFINSVGR